MFNNVIQVKIGAVGRTHSLFYDSIFPFSEGMGMAVRKYIIVIENHAKVVSIILGLVLIFSGRISRYMKMWRSR